MKHETHSRLYEGKVFHRRLRPRVHALSYRVFYMALDLDELPALSRRSRLFSHNGFSLFGFYDRDHGDGSGRPLREWVEAQLARAGVEIAGGRILVLTFPRVLGYVFNPLTIYFCHRSDGSLAAMLYEVNNTFGDRHSYLIPVADGEAQTVEQACDKAFYVSPFIPVSGRYHFKVARPGSRFALTIRECDSEGALLTASFAGEARGFGSRDLLMAFLKHPLMTLKVVAGIHLEAAKLWRKGLRLAARPAAPASAVTIVPFRDNAGSILPPV
ncbi:DUF1365 family protein [Parvibaculum sp.]|uniref:DUF1365 domain-containing protein n=1 Tax=Parvibaculum sp. TaxID=2024848 RepID=UPI001B176464|nr:DUF1365 family protein [Parvibaculum sp.]MBO6634236.1 DUF1365 family protein [Parvibaculum sp.]MBO6679225.1 DUF1365 family protein [Parvibaculum sp.]MBO6684783.1 DUF1365 family protein [Parvibaculum sp.]MBO6904814.1 DUF1365 family protein [Parvibaculum sp.]